jgi:rhamnosyltransferase
MLYALFARPRGQHVRLMLLGLWHGITGRMGRLDL